MQWATPPPRFWVPARANRGKLTLKWPFSGPDTFGAGGFFYCTANKTQNPTRGFREGAVQGFWWSHGLIGSHPFSPPKCSKFGLKQRKIFLDRLGGVMEDISFIEPHFFWHKQSTEGHTPYSQFALMRRWALFLNAPFRQLLFSGLPQRAFLACFGGSKCQVLEKKFTN